MAYSKKDKETTLRQTAASLFAKKDYNTLLVYACVAIITLVTYFVFSPSLDNGFTNWDDNYYVKGDPLVVSNPVPLAKIFETPVDLNYHPITILSLALNYQAGKLDPAGYHLINVILHLLNTILIFFFIFLLTRRNLLMSVIVSLFFGIHPMHVESVSWISERKDVLYVFFFIGGLITYLLYDKKKKMIFYFSTLLLFILSCLSKGMAVVFPVILLLIDYLKGVKPDRRLFVEKIPFFFLSMVFGIIAIKAQSAGNAIGAMKVFSIFQRLMFASYGALLYIVKLFVPVKLSAFYPYPDVHSQSGIPLIFYLSPFILIAFLFALIYLYQKKEKEIVFGLLFYFVSVVLVLQFISVGSSIIADRYSYLSYIGLLFVVASLINKIWQRKSGAWALIKYPLMILVIISAVMFSYQAYSRTQVWKNSEVLWTDVIDNYPDVPIAYFSRAKFYYEDINDAQKAMPDLTKGLQLNPFDKDGYYNRGLLYTKYFNRNDLAIADFTKAIALNDTFKKAYYNRGLLYYYAGKYDSAIADYSSAIKIDPDYVPAYANRGAAYNQYGRTDLALADFNKAIAIDATDADVLNERGSLYSFIGKKDLALADYNRAIALNPSSVPYYYNRGVYYNSINQYEKALDDFTKAIQLNPRRVEVCYNMRGICNVSLQRYSDAIADFSKAIELNPSLAVYWLNRSFAENKIGQNESAKEDALKAQQLEVK